MVSKEEVKHLGWLSRIDLSEEELAKYTSQIEEIIKYFDKLDNIQLTEVEQVSAKKEFSELRKDRAINFEGNVLGTKYRKEGFVKGPRMV